LAIAAESELSVFDPADVSEHLRVVTVPVQVSPVLAVIFVVFALIVTPVTW